MAVHARRIEVCSTLLATVIQLTGCGDSHGAADPQPAMQRPDATAGAPAPSSAQADGPVTCDRERFPALPAGCPAALITPSDGAPCTLPSGTTCLYRLGDGSKPTDRVAALSCSVSEGRSTWSASRAPCRHDCAITAGAKRSIDAARCAERALEPCVSAITVQAQVDAMLSEIMSAPGAPLLNLSEDALSLQFEDGCPTQVQTGFSHGLDGAEPLLEALSHVRWACALEFTCAVFDGPSTLAAP